MTHYAPTLSSQWATINGHRWRATKHGAYRTDCLMPTTAQPNGGAWLEPGSFARAVRAWLAVPVSEPDRLPYPPRFAPLFRRYAVHAGPRPKSATLFEDAEPIAFVMAAGDPTNPININTQGQQWQDITK